MKALLSRKSASLLFKYGRVILQWAPLAITFFPNEHLTSLVKRILSRVPIRIGSEETFKG